MNTKPVEGTIIGDVKWPLEDDIPYLYANHFALVDTGNEFVLAFGNFLPTGLHQRTQEEIKSYLSEADVNQVAKIVISTNGFTALLNLLNDKMEEIKKNKEPKNE